MASLIRILFSCCLGGQRKEEERTPLLVESGPNGVVDRRYLTSEPRMKDTAEELNQKVADLVSNGTNRMIGPGRFNAPYSSASAQLSSSQAHLTAMSSSSHPALNHVDSQQSSHSSPHSSFQPTYQPADLEAQPSEDSASAIDASLARNNSSGPGTGAFVGSGAIATGRRFQIHRGRPLSKGKTAENDHGTRTQANGVPSAGEAADERIHRSEASPSHNVDVDPLPSSPPLQIRTAQTESASRERRQVHFKLPPPKDLLVEFDT